MAAAGIGEALAILQLINALSPAGISLIKTLATSLQGKSDAEILAEGSTIWQSVVDTAKKELGQ